MASKKDIALRMRITAVQRGHLMEKAGAYGSISKVVRELIERDMRKLKTGR